MIDWGAYVFGLCVGLALGAFLTFAIVGTFAWNDGYKSRKDRRHNVKAIP